MVQVYYDKLPTVYIMANWYITILYTGVTGYPHVRIPMHVKGQGSRFAAQYRATKLLYYEHHPTMIEAIKREKQIKRWRREWKLDLIRSMNPEMKDLSGDFREF